VSLLFGLCAKLEDIMYPLRLLLLTALVGACAPSQDKSGSTDGADLNGAEPIKQDGSFEYPFGIPVVDDLADYDDQRDTRDSTSDRVDTYPPHEQDESGPEYFYVFEIERSSRVEVWLDYPEPSGGDVDVHLSRDITPIDGVDRDHYAVTGLYPAGTYYVVIDSWVNGEGTEFGGEYTLNVDIEPFHAGDADDIIPLEHDVPTPVSLPLRYVDTRDTLVATSTAFDSYPPYSQDQSGPEFIYGFTIDEPVRFTAELLAPVPEGVDIDLHLLNEVDESALIERDDATIFTYLQPGTYYIVADTYADMAGEYELMVTLRPDEINADDYFNEYILEAVDYLYAEYGILGYDSAVLTHDIPYGDYGTIEATKGAKTMCVAAVLEVILTAMEIYEADTGDDTVWDYLPERSWEYLGAEDFKAHVWVNYDLESGGTADAARHFGMGENIRFQDLLPGSVINLNRTTGTGHAVIFLAYIDEFGNESDTWHEEVVGFLYFSSQGGYDVGAGGLDYRYAIFEQFGYLDMPYKRDVNIIYSEDQTYLNTGMLFHPTLWEETPYVNPTASYAKRTAGLGPIARFEPSYFTGWTIDD